jgi:hypothetical protein
MGFCSLSRYEQLCPYVRIQRHADISVMDGISLLALNPVTALPRV